MLLYDGKGSKDEQKQKKIEMALAKMQIILKYLIKYMPQSALKYLLQRLGFNGHLLTSEISDKNKMIEIIEKGRAL